MKKSILLTSLFALGMLTTSCQSNSYKIVVNGEGLGESDTLYLSDYEHEGVPTDTLIGKDGKYQLEGTTDSVYQAVIYSQKSMTPVTFFVEPGTIEITLSDNPTKVKIGGTSANKLMQTFNDSAFVIYTQASTIAEALYQNQLTEEEQKAKEAELHAMEQKLVALVKSQAEANTDNEWGYYLLTSSPTEYFDDNTRAELLGKMPEKFRQRTAVKEMLAQIEKRKGTAEGAVMPDLTINTLEGGTASILSLAKQNKLTVIDFWASWCGPCRAEMPTMVKLYTDYKDKGFGIIGVSLDNDKEQWGAAVNQLGMKWPQLSDLKGWDCAYAQLFAVSSIPFTVVVDQQGKILKKGLRGEELVEFVEGKLSK